MRRSKHRYGLQSLIFATNPWGVVRQSVQQRCDPKSVPEATAFCNQAEEYYHAATTSGLVAAKPVLLYYSFLNLAKAYVLTVGQRHALDRIVHGLSERLRPGGVELSDAYLEAEPTRSQIRAFDEFLRAVSGHALPAKSAFDITALLPQLLQGHRLWCSAAQSRERFIEIARVELRQDKSAREIWLTLYLFEDDLTRIGVSRKALLDESGLGAEFREVRCTAREGSRRMLEFEQVAPVSYTHRASDKVQLLVGIAKPYLWANILSVPPYRKYYLYLSPNGDRSQVLPQLLSIYAIFFYFGSITRYRPHRFEDLLRSPFAAQIEEILTNHPGQFLYLITSEFARQEVTRAAII